MPRVSAGSKSGPGWGCTCPSHLKFFQYLAAMGRASTVTFEYWMTEVDGTVVFHAWSDPDQPPYRVTFNPNKTGNKVCKHIMACSAHFVGPWLTEGWNEVRKGLEKWHEASKQNRALQRKVQRLTKKR